MTRLIVCRCRADRLSRRPRCNRLRHRRPQARAPGPRRTGATPRAPRPTSPLPNDKDSVKFLVIGDTGTGDSSQYQVAPTDRRGAQALPVRVRDHARRQPLWQRGAERLREQVREAVQAAARRRRASSTPRSATTTSRRSASTSRSTWTASATTRYSQGRRRLLRARQHLHDAAADRLAEGGARSDRMRNGRSRTSTTRSTRPASGTARSVDLQVLLEPLFLQYGVDVVFSGHEHFYERMKPQKGIVYITQGGGAKLRRGNICATTPPSPRRDSTPTILHAGGDRRRPDVLRNDLAARPGRRLRRRSCAARSQSPQTAAAAAADAVGSRSSASQISSRAAAPLRRSAGCSRAPTWRWNSAWAIMRAGCGRRAAQQQRPAGRVAAHRRSPESRAGRWRRSPSCCAAAA